MALTDGRPTSEAPRGETSLDGRRKTLPPPEWSSPRAGSRRPPALSADPLPRRSGTRAEEAWLRARVEEARAAGDDVRMREACATLARWLASRDRDLDEAVDLGTTALALGAELELRREVSAWLESLGEPSRAASVLKPATSTLEVETIDVAYALVRSGVLKARSGAAAGAAAAFEAAMTIDPDDALAAELIGALSAWQPDAVSASAGAEAYVEAARRRGLQSQDDAAEEDLWRAFATDPTSEAAAFALAGALQDHARPDAGDEVLRAHARALSVEDSAGAAQVHVQRRMAALDLGEPVRALGSAFDQALDTARGGEESQSFDALLLGVGMLDALAARLETRADAAHAFGERALHFAELGKLSAGPLSDPVRALAAYAAALAADPFCDAAIRGLRAVVRDLPHVFSGDSSLFAPLRALATSIDELQEEPQRVERLLEQVGLAVPRIAGALHPSDQASEGIAASRAWVRASFEDNARDAAMALERVAATVAPALRATLLCVAADRYAWLGDASAARRTAETATIADPGSVRAIATLADAVVGERDPAAAAALERGITLVGPRLAWCSALSDVVDALGNIDLAVAWSQRCVALRPGEIGAVERLMARLLRAGDAGRLADSLAWLLSQPQPLANVAASFGSALRDLSRVDGDRAAVVARRALDVFGPKSAPVRDALLDAAIRAGDEAFVAAVFERWLSCRSDGADRRALFVRLAELYARLGDEDGEARIVARAIGEELSSPAIEAHLDRLSGRPASPDGQLWRMSAQASRLAPGDDVEAAVRAWRELGAGLWDLADDRMGAIAAWQRAARLGGLGGHATFALDLVSFGGAEFAFDYLGRLIDSEPDGSSAAAIATDVARAALSLGQPRVAFDLAARGVRRCPSWADAIEVAELAAPQAGDLGALSRLYETVGARALGRFGRRAAHYRGARFFERRSEPGLALKHASQAFAALPSEGASFRLVARLAVRAGDCTDAIRAVEAVAEGSLLPHARAAWLLRAARIAGLERDGAKRKVDMILRAVASYPTVSSVAELGSAIRALLALEPDEREAIEMRFARASRAVTERLRGPEGARVSLAFAGAAIELFDDAATAFASFERAFSFDADVDEFGALVPYAVILARAEDASARVAAMLASVEASQANAGVATLRALGDVGAAAGHAGLAAHAAVLSALREPESDVLVVAADAASRAAPEWASRLGSRVSTARRGQALVAVARARAAGGSNAEAARLFERALDCVDDTERVAVAAELRAAAHLAGQGAPPLDANAAAHDPVSPRVRADYWAAIAEDRERRQDAAGAVRALLDACRLDPDSLERWSALERVAEMAGDGDARVLALEHILPLVSVEGQGAALRRLARAHAMRGDGGAAERAWRQLLTVDPEDEEADQAVESIVVADGRFAELAEHLARRATRLSGDPARSETLRAVRLRRAAILEQRLGLLEEACAELERLLLECPDNPGGLRYLADLLDRQGEQPRAALLWSRAAALESDPAERDDLDLRAARASRDSGQFEEALDGAARVLARSPSNSMALAIRSHAARSLGTQSDSAISVEALTDGEAEAVSKSDWLVENALAAARRGNLSLALAQAADAAAAAPHRATPQLLARGLEYRLRGAGTPEDARATIEELGKIREPLGVDDMALRAFLVAEALDVVQGQAAGLRELNSIRAVAGDHALVALGVAERLASQGQCAAAVEAYRTALAGAFLGLRPPSAVAMSATDSAMRAGLPHEALYFLKIAERYEDTRAAAQAWSTLIADELAARGPGPATTWSEGAALDDLETAVQNAKTPSDRARAHLALGRRRGDRGDLRGAELLFREALAGGLVEAGDALADLLKDAPDRARDLLRVRRQQVALEPGDMGRLERLRASAIADGDAVYAAAVEHVLRAAENPSRPLAPPPLAAKPEQQGMFNLLARPSSDNVGEALALLWEGAAQLFGRSGWGQTLPDASNYAMPGIERVIPAPRPTIARIYDLAIRALDAPRIPLFVSQSGTGPPSSRVGLLWPPSVFLSGDLREETPELLFELGRGMSAALPQNVLCLGLAPAEGRAVVEALRVAFAPPEAGRPVEAHAARLAESFWQIVPAGTQRRIQLLLQGGAFPEYGALVERCEQSGRRVGMFLAGDFSYAARLLVAQTPSIAMVPLEGNLRALCQRSPTLADLVRLAVSPEYASARWHGAPLRSPAASEFLVR